VASYRYFSRMAQQDPGIDRFSKRLATILVIAAALAMIFSAADSGNLLIWSFAAVVTFIGIVMALKFFRHRS
jgi:uncharacterized membrane protein HdeD (DUF308 family)